MAFSPPSVTGNRGGSCSSGRGHAPNRWYRPHARPPADRPLLLLDQLSWPRQFRETPQKLDRGGQTPEECQLLTFSLTVKTFVKSFRVILILGLGPQKNFLNLVS